MLYSIIGALGTLGSPPRCRLDDMKRNVMADRQALNMDMEQIRAKMDFQVRQQQ